MNRKSIQILRGSESYDPKTSTEFLLEGQPFYSKKNKKLYIGDGTSTLNQLKGTEIGLNLENGEASGSLKQAEYTSDGLHQDFKHYAVAQEVAGDSASITAVEELMETPYETLLSQSGITEQDVFNLIDQTLASEGFDITKQNEVNATASTALGVGNTINSPASLVVGYNNILGNKSDPFRAQESIVIGSNNEVGTRFSLTNGYKLINDGLSCKVVLGACNKTIEDSLLEIGNGASPEEGDRSNAFVVMSDGRVKVNGSPIDDNDAVRKVDVATTTDFEFFNSLY